jgi:hypothetical protein
VSDTDTRLDSASNAVSRTPPATISHLMLIFVIPAAAARMLWVELLFVVQALSLACC